MWRWNWGSLTHYCRDFFSLTDILPQFQGLESVLDKLSRTPPNNLLIGSEVKWRPSPYLMVMSSGNHICEAHFCHTKWLTWESMEWITPWHQSVEQGAEIMSYASLRFALPLSASQATAALVWVCVACHQDLWRDNTHMVILSLDSWILRWTTIVACPPRARVPCPLIHNNRENAIARAVSLIGITLTTPATTPPVLTTIQYCECVAWALGLSAAVWFYAWGQLNCL